MTPLSVAQQFAPATYFAERAEYLPFPMRSPRQGIGDTQISDFSGTDLSQYDGSSSNSYGTSDAIGGATAGVFAGIQAALTSGSALGGGIVGGLTLAATIPGPQQPFIALAAGLASPIMSMFKGCGQTCVQATEIANKAGDMLTQVKNDYFRHSLRTRSMQYTALQLFDAIAAEMQKACGNPALGAAGQRCISERLVRGGTAPWCDHPGKVGCDWITMLRDPIANDPDVVEDPVSSPAVSGSLSLSSLPMPLILGAAALGVAFLMAGDQ